MSLFVVASALAGVAQSEAMLIGARFLQGVGGALGSAVILGMIVRMFPDARDRAKAIGIYSFVAAAGGSVGLLAGGVLTDALSWHWIFFVNLPIGVFAALAATRVVADEDGLGLKAGADVPGAITITAALMIGVYAIVGVPDHGAGSAQTLILAAVSVALLGVFVWRESTAANPMVPLGVFRSRNTTGANLIQVLMVAGLFGMFFLGALYLQRLQGYSPVEVGLAFLPVPVFIGGLSLGLAEKLITRYGSRTLMIPGLVSVAAGLIWFSQVPAETNYLWDVFPAVSLLGLGAGLTFPAMITLAMSDVPEEDSGLASGLVNTTQQMGGALGLAVLATLSTTHTEGLVSDGESPASALLGGYHLAFGVGVGFLVVAVGLAVAVLTRPEAEAVDMDLVEAEAETLGMEEAA